jgi:hypothetical protein
MKQQQGCVHNQQAVQHYIIEMTMVWQTAGAVH